MLKPHLKVGPLFSRPFSPRRGPTSAAPEPRDYCSTERALNSEPRDDPRSNPLAKKPPLPAPGIPTHGLTMQKLAPQLKIPIFTTAQSKNEKSQQGGIATTNRFENKIPLFSRPLSPEAVQQWTADVKRRDSFGNGGNVCNSGKVCNSGNVCDFSKEFGQKEPLPLSSTYSRLISAQR